MSDTLRLVEALIARDSVTPLDGGCQALMAERLTAVGFECTTLTYGPLDAPVTNLWAIKRGHGHASGSPTLVFAGHTDVVPTGPLDQWSSPPFVPTHRGGMLYGRGAALRGLRPRGCAPRMVSAGLRPAETSYSLNICMYFHIIHPISANATHT